MKNKLCLSFFIIAISAIIFSSCGKYEEGPNVSLKSKKARVANDWVLDELYINGEKQNLSTEQRTAVFTLTKEGKASTTGTTFIGSYNANGVWAFYDDKEELKVTLTYTIIFSITVEKIYTITKLKEKEMWLVIDEGNDRHEYHYVSK